MELNRTMPREEFTSTGGQYINLGSHKNKSSSLARYEPSFTHHVSVTPSAQQDELRSGLRETRFHRGFQRRPQAAIENVFADEERRRQEAHRREREVRIEKQNLQRGEMLKTINNRAGYDIITGAKKSSDSSSSSLNHHNYNNNNAYNNSNNSNNNSSIIANMKSTNNLANRTQGIKPIPSQGLGPEAFARGQATLRETDGRFFRPLASGPAHEYRQDVLRREGLAQRERHAAIIQPGRKDIVSFGVEDQFSKSTYINKSERASTGLHEALLPGRFTPRKVPTEPSGRAETVQRWTTDIDLNHRTMRGLS